MPNTKHHRNPRLAPEIVENENVNAVERHVVNNLPVPPQDGGDNHGSRFQLCCVPTGCSDDPIDITDPFDAVRVICNNDACTEGIWMHKDCFVGWEQSVLSFLRSCGRARSWSEKQRLQNLWTKKGYDLAYKACDCKCGRGHLRKNLDYIPPPINDNARKVRKNKKKNDKPMPVVSTNHKAGQNSNTPGHNNVGATAAAAQRLVTNLAVDNHIHHQPLQNQLVDNGHKPQRKEPGILLMSGNTKRRGSDNTINNNPSTKLSTLCSGIIRSRNNSSNQNDISSEMLDNGMFTGVSAMSYTSGGSAMLPNGCLRLRTNSVSSTGSVGSQASSGSIPSSAGSLSPLPSSPTNGNMFLKGKKMDVLELHHQSGIFLHRQDLSAFSALPRSKQNPYNIHIEDAQEDEDTRNFVLSNLTNKRMAVLRCVLCKTQLPVFDRFPLVDGTMFLSPQAYGQFVVQVIWEGRIQFLNTVCISCLEGASDARCSSCKASWDGTSFVIGTMYTYDIFAAMPCCQKRLTCKHCRRAVVDVSTGLNYYSQYSQMIICPYCKANDYHFIRSLDDTFSVKDSICGHC